MSKNTQSTPNDFINSRVTSLHSVKIKDVLYIESKEAKLTSSGWEIPLWVQVLRREVEMRDGLTPGQNGPEMPSIPIV